MESYERYIKVAKYDSDGNLVFSFISDSDMRRNIEINAVNEVKKPPHCKNTLKNKMYECNNFMNDILPILAAIF